MSKIAFSQQSICDIAEPLCSNESFSGNPPSGNPGGTINGGCQNLEADDVTWYVVRIYSGTTFTFEIIPNGSDDYDFAVWKNPNCNNLGVATRASYAAPTPYRTGLSMTANDTCETAFGDGFVKYLDVQPGDLILIAVDKFSDHAAGFTLSFDNGGNADLDCTIIGENYGICDLDFDGQEDFDLNIIRADITENQPTWTVDFYANEADAQAGNTNTLSSPYTAYMANNPTGIYARIKSNGSFLRVMKVFLHVNNQPVLTGPATLSLCDSDGNGTEVFDLTLAQGQLIVNPNDYTFKYYVSQADAMAGGNNNINPATAYTSGNATIYVRVETGPQDGNDEGCFAVDEVRLILTDSAQPEFSFDLTYCLGETPPVLPLVSDNGVSGTWFPPVIDTSVLGVTTYTFTPDSLGCVSSISLDIQILAGVTLNQINPIALCSAAYLGTPSYVYDLTLLNSQLTSPVSGLIFSYYTSIQNANDGIAIPQTQWTNYTFTSLPASIWVKASTVQGCESELVEVQFIEQQSVQHGNGPFILEFCGDETIDLTALESTMATETGVNFSYYESLLGAQNGTNPIQNLTDYEASGDATIYVRLEKANRCLVILELELKEKESPSIEGLEPLNRVICDGDQIEINLTSDTSNAIFVWTWGEVETYTGANFVITEPGVYTITVTGGNNCTATEQLVVRPAEQPIIRSIETGNDYLIVYAVSGGGGTLEYSLNGVIWQDSPRFDNLVKGELYTVYVREDGCMITSYQVSLLNINNFVSPNGDGYNDTWEVRGIEFSPKTTIKIFDRNGKIFVDTTFEGGYSWDGKYLGRPVPSGDYWYIMEVPSDGITVAKKFVGHISIRN